MTRGISRRGFLTGVLGASALAVSGCVADRSVVELTMGCGEKGGSYLQFGELLSAALTDSSDVRIRPVQTAGSVENLLLLEAGEVDLALALADSAMSDGFVALGRVYQNYLQCVVRADSGITTIDQLRGRVVSLGATGSGAAGTSRRLLTALGLLGYDDPVIAVERRLADAVSAVETGEIDALFWSGGIPTPQIDGMAGRVPVRLLDTTAGLPALSREAPGVYYPAAVPSGIYGIERRTPTVGIPNLIVARADLPDRPAALVVDALVEDALQLIPEGALGLQYLTSGGLIDTAPFPLHPAAARRYRERYA